jgi:hypothetical protein
MEIIKLVRMLVLALLPLAVVSCGGGGGRDSAEVAGFCSPLRELQGWFDLSSDFGGQNIDAFGDSFTGLDGERAEVLAEGASLYEHSLTQAMDYAPSNDIKDEMEYRRRNAAEAASHYGERARDLAGGKELVVMDGGQPFDPPLADPTFLEAVADECSFSPTFDDPYASNFR